MGYVGVLLLIIPQMLLIVVSVLLITSFAVIYVMKWAVKLSSEEIVSKKGSLVPLALTAWGFNYCTLAMALIIMDIVSCSIPFFEGIHSEWGIASANAYTPAAVYIACLGLLHAAMLSLSYSAFRKRITSKPKRIKIFITFVVSSALIWALVMCFLVLRIL